jgi:hypothetical protein
MKYTVVWKPAVLQQLARIWNSATDRAAVTAAADSIDAALIQDPLTKGEARTGPTRILVEAPLAVYFNVSQPDRLVSVWAVWRWVPQP